FRGDDYFQLVPYAPEFTITPQLMSLVEAIAALRERIQGATVEVPWVPALQKDARARNAHSSTAIEGNPLTLEQVRAVEAGGDLPSCTTASKPFIRSLTATDERDAPSGCGSSIAVDSIRTISSRSMSTTGRIGPGITRRFRTSGPTERT